MLRYYSGSRADRVRKPLSPPRQCGAFAEHMLPIPTKFFVTSGKAVSKVSDLNAFDEALQNAGLAEQNIVSVSSVLPVGIRPVRQRDLPMGAITHCVLAAPARAGGRADSARELAPLVGKVSAELAGGTEEYRRARAPVSRRRSRDVHVRVIAVAGKGRDRASRVRSAAIELTRELEVFSLSDWERVLAGLGIPNPAEALATLVEENTVFEPKAGFFRAVALNP